MPSEDCKKCGTTWSTAHSYYCPSCGSKSDNKEPQTDRAEASSLSELLTDLVGLAEEWEKQGGHLNNPHDHPEDRAGGRVYQECAKALRKITNGS